MTFIDALAALLILGFFLFGLSDAVLPAYKAWNSAAAEYRTARTIRFVAQSFRNECAKQDRNIERWEKANAAAKELESFEISEMRQGDILRALKAACVISGERVEIIGVCTP